MASLARYFAVRSKLVAEAQNRQNHLYSGIVVRHDGAQVIVNIGGQSYGCQPTLGLPLLAGDSVWVRIGFGAPLIMGVQSRSSEVR